MAKISAKAKVTYSYLKALIENETCNIEEKAQIQDVLMLISDIESLNKEEEICSL